MTTGIFVRGKCIGVNSQQRSANGRDYIVHSVGIQVEQPSQFGEPDLITRTLKITNEQAKANLHQAFGKLQGQIIEVPVFLNEWQLDDGKSGVTLVVSKGYQPRAVNQKPAA